jgi:hypothetical protein
MAKKYTRDELIERLKKRGWGLVTGNQAMPLQGTLSQIVEATHDRHSNGHASGYIKEIETAIEVDMLQIQDLWHHLGLPV